MTSSEVLDHEESSATLTSIMNVSLFEESQISPTVNADDAPTFFKEHGIFYKADAEIGRQARALGCNSDMRKQMLMKDPVSVSEQVLILLLTSLLRLARILEPFINNPPVPIFLGPDQGNFFAFTNKGNQDHRLIIYFWPAETTFDFFDESHRGFNKGVPASNGYVQIPYSWLKDKDKRNLREFRGVLKDGGVYVCSSRHSSFTLT